MKLIQQIKTKAIKNMPDSIYAFLQTFSWKLNKNTPSISIIRKNYQWLASFKNDSLYFPTPRTAILGHFLNTHSKVWEKYFNVEKDDIVIDIGAYVGSFCISSSNLAKTIIAIEPNPDAFQCLKLNLKNNNNVILINKGVWNESKKMEFYVDRKYPIANSLVIPPDSCNKIEIEVDSLDNIISSYNFEVINFIKMNIEGAEIEALRGMKDTLLKTEKITMDAHHIRDGNWTIPKVVEILKEFNFEIQIDAGTVYGRKIKDSKL